MASFPSTTAACSPFFKWAVDEDELRESPLARMRTPAVPENPPPVLREEDLAKLLKACDGPRFEDRRDTALLRLLLDTGVGRLPNVTPQPEQRISSAERSASRLTPGCLLVATQGQAMTRGVPTVAVPPR